MNVEEEDNTVKIETLVTPQEASDKTINYSYNTFIKIGINLLNKLVKYSIRSLVFITTPYFIY